MIAREFITHEWTVADDALMEMIEEYGSVLFEDTADNIDELKKFLDKHRNPVLQVGDQCYPAGLVAVAIPMSDHPGLLTVTRFEEEVLVDAVSPGSIRFIGPKGAAVFSLGSVTSVMLKDTLIFADKIKFEQWFALFILRFEGTTDKDWKIKHNIL